MKHLYLVLRFAGCFCVLLLTSNYAVAVDAYIQNSGQITDQYRKPNTDVLYLFNGSGINMQLRKTGFSYDVWHVAERTDEFQYHRIDISFVNCNPGMIVVSNTPSQDYLNYYTAHTGEMGITKVHSFQQVLYRNVWQGIDISFELSGDAPKYNFILHPGAKLSDVQINIQGSDKIVSTGASLLLTADNNIIEEKIPHSYYTLDGEKKTVQASFTGSGEVYGITLKEQVPVNATLVIDPVPTVLWGTMYGANGKDYGRNTVTAPNGDVYLSGYTRSTTSIATTGAFKSSYVADEDVFIAKFRGNGTRIWATYYGGDKADYPNDMAINSTGSFVYLAGNTYSDTGIASAGAHQTVYDTQSDLYLLKLDSAGQRIWCTYYGGNGDDNPASIAVDRNDNIYLAGATYSSNNIATAGAYKPVAPIGISGSSQSFLAKFNALGNRLWGTYYGGNDDDKMYIAGIYKDSVILLTGYTSSDTGIATAGTYQSVIGGSSDLFLARFDSAGNFRMGTYFGDALNEYTDYKGTVDDSGNVYIHGFTQSTANMTSINAHQTVFGGVQDGVLAKFSMNLNRVWSTYYGGDGAEETNSIAIDKDLAIYLTGTTQSTNNIATPGTWQDTNPFGGAHMFISKFGNDGTQKWGTYLQGAAALGACIDKDNDLYLAGWSSVAAVGTAGAHQQFHGGGGNDAFLLKIKGCHKGFATAGPDNSSLLGTQLYLFSGPSGMFSYTWSHPGGFTSNLQNPVISNSLQTDSGIYIVTVTDSAKCTDTASMHVDVFPWGSVNDLNFKTLFNIYPNPANGVLYLENKMTQKAELNMSTIEGRVVYSKELTPGKNTINTQALATGTYFINIRFADKTETIKIQVQR